MNQTATTAVAEQNAAEVLPHGDRRCDFVEEGGAMTTIPAEAGKSSFGLIDKEGFFAALPLESVQRVLDLGCGVGNYTLPLAERLGPRATVHGVDLWSDGVNQLLQTAREKGLENVTAESADLARMESVQDSEADLALMATVLHDQVERGVASAALREAARVVRRNGWLAVVEFKKIDTKPGPPLAIRLSAEDLTALVGPYGFLQPRVVDLGPNLYLALFQHVASVSHA